MNAAINILKRYLPEQIGISWNNVFLAQPAVKRFIWKKTGQLHQPISRESGKHLCRICEQNQQWSSVVTGPEGETSTIRRGRTSKVRPPSHKQLTLNIDFTFLVKRILVNILPTRFSIFCKYVACWITSGDKLFAAFVLIVFGILDETHSCPFGYDRPCSPSR